MVYVFQNGGKGWTPRKKMSNQVCNTLRRIPGKRGVISAVRKDRRNPGAFSIGCNSSCVCGSGRDGSKWAEICFFLAALTEPTTAKQAITHATMINVELINDVA